MTNTVKKMTTQDVKTAIRTKQFENMLEYPAFVKEKEGHIFDYNQTVNWNIEKLAEMKAVERAGRDAWDTEQRKLENAFREMTIAAIMYELTMSEECAEFVFSKAWEAGHSSGYYSVVESADEYIDLLSVVLAHERSTNNEIN
jgi:Ni,Fe-hydrogenase I large subunit